MTHIRGCLEHLTMCKAHSHSASPFIRLHWDSQPEPNPPLTSHMNNLNYAEIKQLLTSLFQHIPYSKKKIAPFRYVMWFILVQCNKTFIRCPAENILECLVYFYEKQNCLARSRIIDFNSLHVVLEKANMQPYFIPVTSQPSSIAYDRNSYTSPLPDAQRRP